MNCGILDCLQKSITKAKQTPRVEFDILALDTD